MKHTNEDFFKLFGHISVFFATWDMLTNILIFRLVKNPNIDSRMTLGEKIKYLGHLDSNEVDDLDVLKDIKDFIEESARDVSQERNRYIHDQWIFKESDIDEGKIERSEIVLKPESKDLHLKTTRFSIADIEKFLVKVGACQKKTTDLIARLPVVKTKVHWNGIIK